MYCSTTAYTTGLFSLSLSLLYLLNVKYIRETSFSRTYDLSSTTFVITHAWKQRKTKNTPTRNWKTVEIFFGLRHENIKKKIWSNSTTTWSRCLWPLFLYENDDGSYKFDTVHILGVRDGVKKSCACGKATERKKSVGEPPKTKKTKLCFFHLAAVMKEWGISINIYTYNLAPSVVAKDPWVTGSHQHGTRHQPCLPKPKVTLEFSDWRAVFLQRIRMENVMYQVHRSPLGIGLNCWLTQRFVPRFIFLSLLFPVKKYSENWKKRKKNPRPSFYCGG